MKEIKLTKNKFTVVDDEDFDRLIEYRWHLGPGGCAARSWNKGEATLMHRIIMDAPKGLMVDHIDGNPLNNTKKNLRICGREENLRNTKSSKNSVSKYKGVTLFPKRKVKKWAASIRVGGKLNFIGRFETETQAALIYDSEARKHFGEFGRYNFPKDGEQSAILA